MDIHMMDEDVVFVRILRSGREEEYVITVYNEKIEDVVDSIEEALKKKDTIKQNNVKVTDEAIEAIVSDEDEKKV